MEHEHCCSHVAANPSVQQNLDELDFQRGVWAAAMDGEINKVKKYLSSGADPDAVDSSGYTALHYAARSGHRQICEMLLDHGANVNAMTRSGGATPLHRAAYQGHVQVTQLFVQRGADVTLRDSDGMTALHKAAERSKVAICRLLVEKDRSLLKLKDKKERRPVDCIADDQADLRQHLEP